jgi:hypothetical protein
LDATAAMMSRYAGPGLPAQLLPTLLSSCAHPSHLLILCQNARQSLRLIGPRAAHLPSHRPRQTFFYTDTPAICLLWLGVLCVVLRAGAALRLYGAAIDRSPVRSAAPDLECSAWAVMPVSPTVRTEASLSPLKARAKAVAACRRTRLTTVSSAASTVRSTTCFGAPPSPHSTINRKGKPTLQRCRGTSGWCTLHSCCRLLALSRPFPP